MLGSELHSIRYHCDYLEDTAQHTFPEGRVPSLGGELLFLVNVEIEWHIQLFQITRNTVYSRSLVCDQTTVWRDLIAAVGGDFSLVSVVIRRIILRRCMTRDEKGKLQLPSYPVPYALCAGGRIVIPDLHEWSAHVVRPEVGPKRKRAVLRARLSEHHMWWAPLG